MTIIITFIDTKTTSWGLTALNLRKQQGRATESLITSEREREREREKTPAAGQIHVGKLCE